MYKLFTAHYRYPLRGLAPGDYFVVLEAKSLAEAKAIAKGYQGISDHMTWFVGIKRKDIEQ